MTIFSDDTNPLTTDESEKNQEFALVQGENKIKVSYKTERRAIHIGTNSLNVQDDKHKITISKARYMGSRDLFDALNAKVAWTSVDPRPSDNSVLTDGTFDRNGVLSFTLLR